MAPEIRPPYPDEPGPIGTTRKGMAVSLSAMTTEASRLLGPALAAIDPWARAGISGDRLGEFFARSEAGASRYKVLAGGELAGVMVVRLPWLHGPYLHFLGLLPAFHSQGIGSVALDWLEAEAQGRFRNLWLCVSSFNSGARAFYEAHDFKLTAPLEDLVFDGQNELLMRKRLV